MNAKEFIKQYGWEIAKRDVVCLETRFITKADFLENYGFEILDDLKQFVDAWDLVESLDGLSSAKITLQRGEFGDFEMLKQAIELMESVNE